MATYRKMQALRQPRPDPVFARRMRMKSTADKLADALHFAAGSHKFAGFCAGSPAQPKKPGAAGSRKKFGSLHRLNLGLNR